MARVPIIRFLGTASGAVAQTITPTAVASSSSVGTPSVLPGAVTITPTMVASSSSVGTPTITAGFTITPTMVSSSSTIGTPSVSPGAVTITPTMVASSSTVGSPTVARAVTGDCLLLDTVLEGTLTVGEALRIILAAVSGKVSGVETGTLRFRDVADSKDRIVTVTDTNSNRTSVTLDGSE